MGCVCFRSEKADDDQSSNTGQEQYSKERLHTMQGSTQIDVKNGHLHEIQAQCLVSVIDNKGRGGGSDILIHNIASKKYLKPLDVENQYEFGTIVPVPLDEKGKQAVFLVLPLWKAGDSETKYLTQAIESLISYITNNSIQSVAIEEIGVKRLGYPRQIVIKTIVAIFGDFFKRNIKSGIEHLWFISNEMTTVALFENEIQRVLPPAVQKKNYSGIQSLEENQSFGTENRGQKQQITIIKQAQSELQSPLLGN